MRKASKWRVTWANPWRIKLSLWSLATSLACEFGQTLSCSKPRRHARKELSKAAGVILCSTNSTLPSRKLITDS